MSIGSAIGIDLSRAIGSALAGGQSYASIVSNGVLAPYVTFTRAGAGTATYFDSAGTQQVAAENTPRIDYDPVTLALRGLLVEEQRTNLCLRSTMEGGGDPPTGWAKVIGTGTSAATASIYGNADGAAAYSQSATAQRPFYQMDCTTVAATVYTASMYIEAVSGVAYKDIIAINGVTSSAYRLNGVAVIPTDAAAVGRVEIVFTAPGATSGLRVGIGVSGVATGALTFSRPQLEAGAFATSYIPTTSAAATRNADSAVVSMLSSIGYNASEGTLYVEGYTAPGIGASNISLVSFNDNTANELIALRHLTGGTTHDYTVVDGGVTQVDTAGTAVTAGSAIKAAIAWKANYFAQSVNGGAAQTVASGTIPTVDRLTIGAFNGRIKTLRYYPRRLSNAELVALTT